MIQKCLNLKKKLINIHMMSEGYAKFALRWVKLVRYGQKAVYEACMSFTQIWCKVIINTLDVYTHQMME